MPFFIEPKGNTTRERKGALQTALCQEARVAWDTRSSKVPFFLLRQECAKFLKTTKVLHCGKQAFTFSLGDLRDPETLARPLARMRALTTAVKRMLSAVRPDSGWLTKFTSYRLPSPWSSDAKRLFPHLSDQELQALKNTVREGLVAIWQRANLNAEACWVELLQLLPSAESHRRAGAALKLSWARASADFPELAIGRRLAGIKARVLRAAFYDKTLAISLQQTIPGCPCLLLFRQCCFIAQCSPRVSTHARINCRPNSQQRNH